MRKYKIRGISIVLSLAILGTSALLVHNKKNKDYNKKMYNLLISEEGAERDILKYLEVSDDLEELDLEDYVLGKEVTSNLDKPIKIKKEINEYDSSNLTNLIYLKEQEELVNNYINENGYDIVNNYIKGVIKKYAAEVYDIQNPSDIDIEYRVNTSGEIDYLLIYNASNNQKVTIIEDKNIKKGAEYILKTKKFNNLDEIDNKQRNKILKETLIIARKLLNDVNEEDLYNEKAAQKLKK